MPTILVVDDDRAVQSMLVDLLEEHGYKTETARNGRQALERLEAEQFDMMILDVLIPHINGFALMEQIRTKPALRELPVVMVSGIYRARNHRAEMTSRYAVIDYLDKPLQPDKLLELVRGAVGEAKPGRETNSFVGDRDEIRPEEPAKPTVSAVMRAIESDERIVEPAAREEKAEVEAAARESFKTSAFLLQGSIKKTPVAALLGKLWHQKDSGALLLRNDKVKKIIYVDKGEVVGVKSNLVSECLGRLLVRERLINPDHLEESIRRMKDQGKRQGEVLVGMNVITDKNLKFALELQLETKVFDTFTWDAGEYRFNSSVTDMPTADVQLEWRGGALVVEGVRRTFDETRLRALMLPIIDVPLRFRDGDLDLPSLRFTKAELGAIAAMKSSQSTRQLIDSLPMEPPDALRVIYTLIALDLLVPSS